MMKLILLTFEEIKISTSQKLEFCKSPTNLHFIYIYITESLSLFIIINGHVQVGKVARRTIEYDWFLLIDPTNYIDQSHSNFKRIIDCDWSTS